MRLLRNRISHYEPIWQGMSLPSRRKKTPPRIVSTNDLHSELIETIAWINPTMRDTMASLDLYPIVERRGSDMIEKRLKRQLQIS